MNLVDLIKGQIGGDTLSKLASAIGAGTDDTRSAVDAAVPTVLAGLTQVASTPEGARKLDSTIDQLQDGSTDGSGILGSLFGGGMLSSIAGALGKFTGMSAGSIGALLASVGPMILGVLGRQKSSLGLDAGGMANLLGQQKQNIASAMPAGLGNLLSGVPGIGSMVGGASHAAGRVADTTRDVARGAVNAVTPRASMLPWALGAAAALLLGLLLWKGMSGTSEPAPQASAPPANMPAAKPRPAEDLTNAIPAGAQIPAEALSTASTKLTDTLKSATESFSSITDSASADAALPKLRDVSTQLDSVTELANKLPAQGKSQLTTMLKPMLDKINPLIDKALAIPGVSDKLGPVAKEIRTKLTALAAN